MTAIIYMFRNKLNNGKPYIGSTSRSVNIRWDEHCRSAKRGVDSHFCNAIRKYGTDDWELQILYEGENNDWVINVAEPFFIALYDTFKGEGYNMTSGGEGAKEVSEETRKKMSESHKGVPRSEETKRKMSIANSGEKNYFYGKSFNGKEHPKWTGYWVTPNGTFESSELAAINNGFKSHNSARKRCHHKTNFPDWSFIPK
tara:strand:- start:500 stop:1099 length:600 start_codon:yes stop_codon:yes gene_type:complete